MTSLADAASNTRSPDPGGRTVSILPNTAVNDGAVADAGAGTPTAPASSLSVQSEPRGFLASDQVQQTLQTQTVAARDPLAYPEVAQGFEPSADATSNAEDVDEQGWKQIFKINQLLHGFQIRQENQDVIRARKNAFELKTASANPPGAFIPTFQVDDSTLVEVYETKNDLQRSLARNAFSKRSIETNLSAAEFGVDIGPLWRREGSKTEMAEVWTESEEQEYYATYIFPRARVFLDEEEIQITTECGKALRALERECSYSALQNFYKRFGHVFVTSVLLGGQQKTTKFAGAVDERNNAKREDAIRWAVGAKVNAPYVNVGTQYSREKGSDDRSAESDYINSSYLALSATGGDTLIGADIPKWAPTVAPYKNWRVVKNEIARPIQNVIGSMSGWKHIPRLFRQIYQERSAAGRAWKGNFSLWVDDEPLCWDESAKLYVKRSASTTGSQKAIFRLSDVDKPTETPDAVTTERAYNLRPSSTEDRKHVIRFACSLDVNVPMAPDSEYRGTNGCWICSGSRSHNCRFVFRTEEPAGTLIASRGTPQAITSNALVKIGCTNLWSFPGLRNETEHFAYFGSPGFYERGPSSPEAMRFHTSEYALTHVILGYLSPRSPSEMDEALGQVLKRTGATSLRYADFSIGKFVAMEKETRLQFDDSVNTKGILRAQTNSPTGPLRKDVVYSCTGKRAWLDGMLKRYPLPKEALPPFDIPENHGSGIPGDRRLWLLMPDKGKYHPPGQTTFRVVFE